MVKIYTLYIHKNKITGQEYCGVTSDVKRRWSFNGIEYKNYKSEKQTPFYEAILEYGWDNFDHIILKSNLTKDEAYDLEKEYIASHNLTDIKYGYNVCKGGKCDGILYKEHPKGMLGKTHSDEYKERLKIMMRGDNNPFKKSGAWDTHEHPRGMLGKTHSKENKDRISKTLKDKKINCKKVLVIYPNGEERVFDSVTQAQESLNLTTRVMYKLLRSGQPYTISKCLNKQHYYLKQYEGLVIKRIDNTELTD